MVDEIRDAATVILLRDGSSGIETFLLRRNPNLGGGQFGDALVFPGGVVDPDDHLESWETWGAKSELPLSFSVAAIRECFEEAGILLCDVPANSQNAVFDDWRAGLNAAERKFSDMVMQTACVPQFDQLVAFSHWLTPKGRPKRFDTVFFVAKAPKDQVASHDGEEATDNFWVLPSQVVADFYARRCTLWPPTLFSLLAIQEFHRVDNLLAHYRQRNPMHMPKIAPILDDEGDSKSKARFAWDQ